MEIDLKYSSGDEFLNFHDLHEADLASLDFSSVAYDSSKVPLRSKMIEMSVTIINNDREETKEEFGVDGSEEVYSTQNGLPSNSEQPFNMFSKLYVSEMAKEAVSSLKPPRSCSAIILLFPLVAVVLGIRMQHASLTEGTEEGHYPKKKTIYDLAAHLEYERTNHCFTLIICLTMVLDFVVDIVDELCERNGQIYVKLTQCLYQELMILGVISFTIFVLNAEGYFEYKKKLFHELEFAHIVCFYIGLGLVVQGLALAIINYEIKNFWRFSTAQTIAEMEEKIETIKKSGRLGNFLLKFGLTDVKRYLDIHLIRISFLRIMNLPANFVYNEYVNHCLDTTTIKIARNSIPTWSFLIALVQLTGVTNNSGFYLGTKGIDFKKFGLFALFIIVVNIFLLLVILHKKESIICLLGGSQDTDKQLELIRAKWPKANAFVDNRSLLKDIGEKVREVKRQKEKQKKISGLTARVAKTAKSIRDKARLSVVERRMTKIGETLKSKKSKSKSGINTKELARFQFYFVRLMQITNLLQGFYISLIISHWAWYATSTRMAFLVLIPIFVVYGALTPNIIRTYAMVMSLGKLNADALSMTIEFMENNEEALHQVAELLVNNMDETETTADIFNEWDINGDNELSFTELKDAILNCNMNMSEELLNAMWRKVDIDSSGSITREEFARAIDPYVLLVKKEHAERAQLYGSDDGEYSDGSSSD